MNFFDRVFRLQGAIFNLVFAGIAVGVHILFRNAPEEFVVSENLARALGLSVLIMMAAETIALFIKFRSPIHREGAGVARVQRVELPGRGWGVLMIGLVHAGASVALGIMAIDALGYRIDINQWVPVAIITAIVIKEIYILTLIILPLERDRPASGFWLLCADITLLVFAAVGYATVLREVVERRDLPLFVAGVDDLWSVLGISAAVFIVFFVPLRLGFVVEENVFARDWIDRSAIWISLLIASAGALVPLLLL